MDALANLGDPAAAVKAIAEKMKQDVAESGMDAAEAFVDKLEDLKERARSGPCDIMDKVKEIMSSFKQKLDDALANPASLAPGGGGLAACASWYGNAVVDKLKSLAAEFQELFDIMKAAAKEMAGPFKEMGNTMGEAMAGINGTVKGLMSLPKEVMALGDTVKGADDLKDVDTGGMKTALDTSGMEGPLDSLGGLKDKMGPVVTNMKGGIEKVNEFVGSAPNTIKNAFAMPTPLCFLTSCAMDQAPQIMTELLEKVKALAEFDFQSILDMLEGLRENVGNLDVSKVREPVSKFAEMARGNIENLDKAVSAAKMSGGLPGGVPKLPW
mmetsp:Transcript_125186/g.389708  ORF Transcript_125186/g.389708 Transcript_125186/m.389708 type:complete len:326 (-) Transcript_125186:87-1064(-)|eukprot:CAMPEP_0204563144 /NCGR_PEP_ID=MMETSP0661-20131031/34148_1 /ASSEMBLY_ACC=CAM_ASM_000606 /TAXON_ID=109239 /ORGANISM="Alexandrium margalefi, Strain AMGDE01CS-322" /LENGTH=325 /DNA_ID=CAMNT_0051570679 /DNA_START=65 /DNA_END=1042 /DNA_ORIENTATION=+